MSICPNIVCVNLRVADHSSQEDGILPDIVRVRVGQDPLAGVEIKDPQFISNYAVLQPAIHVQLPLLQDGLDMNVSHNIVTQETHEKNK